MCRFRTTIVLALSTLSFFSVCIAQQAGTISVPNLIRYTGTVKDAQGVTLSWATPVGVTFAIYKQQDGGAPVWQETQNVTVDANGQYNVLLGSTTATGLPDDLFSQQEQRWLGVQVQGQEEQARVLLVSVPYAFKAHEAETLGGLPPSAFVQAAPKDASGSASLEARTTVATTTNRRSAKDTFAPGPCPNGTNPSPNYIPFFLQPGTLCDSAIFQNVIGSGGYVGVGTTRPGSKLDVNGDVSIAAVSSYRIAGAAVLGVGAPADENLFVGVGAGASNLFGQGVANTFAGFEAGKSNTTGTANTFIGDRAGWSNITGSGNVFSGWGTGLNNTTGGDNAFYGSQAGVANTTGFENTFVGTNAGESNQDRHDNTFVGGGAGFANQDGSRNTFYGRDAGSSNTTGTNNTFSGYRAGYNNIDGHSNNFVGLQAGYSNTSGYDNNFVGLWAGYYNTTGAYNVFIGTLAGADNLSGNGNTYIGNDAGPYFGEGSDNIYLGSGVKAEGDESTTIRIGRQGVQTTTYIAGIYGATFGSDGVWVFADSGGRLGTIRSSSRFKEHILDMGNSSSSLFQLRPVTFFYKPEYDDGSHLLQYGLIAEEVAKVYPELVAYDKDGQPYTVRYQYLAPMLLNELQKQHAVVAGQQDVIKSQQEEIKEMQQRLSRLEALIGMR